ncbi:hypothetical protein [Streptomyces yaizuensis]|uniref:SdpI family protein n=1 Tax=Streptomyces yaizuensis TaxID=2989713 RepID=A0ABQ5NU12_9ACTN|nr:hypothetical protein [Streptomyces sp. YSPA8]GLF93638.1 SdpI family protein [Streptomyces sp. YSPA8]
MNLKSKDLLILLVCGLFPAALAWPLRWPAPLWGLVTLTVLAGVLLMLVVRKSAGAASADAPGTGFANGEPEPPAVPPYQEARMRNVPLPSGSEGYDFLFSATVWWRPMDVAYSSVDGNLQSVAAAAVLSRARAVTLREHPERVDFTRYLLDGALGVPQRDDTALVSVMAADIGLTLAPEDRSRLDRAGEIRKAEEAWERERQYERNKRAYLGSEVLNSTGSAVVWWLARHDNEIEKAVDMIGPLAQISAAANDTEVPELFRHLVPRATVTQEDGGDSQPFTGGTDGSASRDPLRDPISEVLDELDLEEGSDERAVFLDRVARSMAAAGRPDAAARVYPQDTAPQPAAEEGTPGTEDDGSDGGPAADPPDSTTAAPPAAPAEPSPESASGAGPNGQGRPPFSFWDAPSPAPDERNGYPSPPDTDPGSALDA